MSVDTVRGSLPVVAVGATSTSGVIPSATVANDLIFVFLDVNQLASAAGATPATPSGFSAFASPLTSTSAEYYGWGKVAVGGEGGTTLSFTTAASVANRSHLTIVVIEGAAGSSFLATPGVGESTTTTTRVTPTASYSGPGSVIEHVCDKSSAPGTLWTPPSTFTMVTSHYDTTSGQMTSVTALSNSNTLSSPQGGDTYTETATGSQAGKWTIAYHVGNVVLGGWSLGTVQW